MGQIHSLLYLICMLKNNKPSLASNHQHIDKHFYQPFQILTSHKSIIYLASMVLEAYVGLLFLKARVNINSWKCHTLVWGPSLG